MRAAVFHGVQDIRVEELPDPTCGDDDIVIEVAACGVCGTDLSAYEHGSMFTAPGQVMGHEFCGRAVEVGANVRGIGVDDRVTAWPIVHCDWCPRCAEGNWHLCENSFDHSISSGLPGGFADYVRVPRARLNRTVYRLPDEVSWVGGAMVEPLSVSLGAVRFAAVGPSDTVVVMGLGMLGLGVVQALHAAGLENVIGVDQSRTRLELAEKLGANITIDATETDVPERLRELTGIGPLGSAHVDAVIECTGAGAALAQAVEIVRSAGRLVLIGLYAHQPTIDMNALIVKQVEVRGTFAYRTEYTSVLKMLAAGQLDAESLATGRFAISHTSQAFEAQRDRNTAVKTLVVRDDLV